MIKKAFIICTISFWVNASFAQTAHKYLREADKKYESADYISAEELYRKADQKKSSLKSSYNLGNTTFQQERYEESIDYYLNAARKSETKTQESDAFYNLGNAYFQNQDLEEAIKAYKNAIKLNPENKEAQYNLFVSKEIKKQMQQQQQQQEQNQDQDSDSENDEKQEGEDSEEQNQEEQEGEEPQDQEQQEEKKDSTEQIQPSTFDSTRLEKQSLDSLDAAKLLQIIQSEEQKVQEKLRKFNSNRKKPSKDW